MSKEYDKSYLKYFRNIITEEECNEFINRFNQEPKRNDPQVDGSLINRNVSFGKEIFDKCIGRIQSELNTEFGYLGCWIRKYVKGNKLYRHHDDAFEKGYVLSLNLGKSDDIKNILYVYEEDKTHEVELNVGDSFFFPGTILEHEREEIESDYFYSCYLAFKEKPKHKTLF
jgi:hypothetical protein